MDMNSNTKYIIVPAPGHYGDVATVISSHATLAAARRAKGSDASRSIRVDSDGSKRRGSQWLRAYEGLYPVAS